MKMSNLNLFSNLILNRVIDQVNHVIGRSSRGNDHNQTKSNTNSNSNGLLISFLSSFEPYFVSLQSLLIWEKPYLSAIAFVTLNCLFWFIMSWSRRFYSVLALTIFIITFLRLWTRHIWPEIRVPSTESPDNEGWIPLHPQVLSAPEINYYLNELANMMYDSYKWLIELRRSNHGFFCLIITGFLIMTAFIGKIIPGVIIIYALMTTFALGPGIALYVIPHSWLDYLHSILNPKINKKQRQICPKKELLEDEPLLPDICEETAKELLLLEEQNETAPLSFSEFEPTNDESSLQLLLPSQLETTLDDELGMNSEDGQKKSPSRSERSSQCSSCSNGMHFVPSHFSRNSSENDFDGEYELISDSELQDPQQSNK